jgi:hypothetical protein
MATELHGLAIFFAQNPTESIDIASIANYKTNLFLIAARVNFSDKNGGSLLKVSFAPDDIRKRPLRKSHPRHF